MTAILPLTKFTTLNHKLEGNYCQILNNLLCNVLCKACEYVILCNATLFDLDANCKIFTCTFTLMHVADAFIHFPLYVCIVLYCTKMSF